MKILLVAPDSDLSVHAELYAAIEGNDSTILNGVVSRREVTNRIATGDFDVVHFATHGDRDALEMSDGVIDMGKLEEALLRSELNGHFVRMVFLNACRSVFHAAHIYLAQTGAPAFAIGWASQVQDIESALFAVRFYERLSSNGEDVHDAFDSATDVFIHNFPQSDPPIMLNGRMDELRLAMRAMTKEVAALREELSSERKRTAQATVPRWMTFAFVALIIIDLLLAFAVFSPF